MYPSGLEACRLDLYTDTVDLREKYPEDIVAKILRVREMHQWVLDNPSTPDKKIVAECVSRFKISRPTAYNDLHVIKALLPCISKASKEFHKWRYNEMALESYNMAKKRGDVRTMERSAASYAKYNKINVDDVEQMPLDKIVPQPFVATDDPRVLGIEPIPNLRKVQKQLLDKYRKEITDIDDVEYEPADVKEILYEFDDPAVDITDSYGKEENLL